MDLLSDGLRHKKREIFDSCVDDDLAELRSLNVHFTNIRDKIEAQGLDILCRYHNGSITYRLVRVSKP